MINKSITTFKDIQDLLLKFGCFVYFKDDSETIEMIEYELKSLYKSNLITKEQYIQCKYVLIERGKVNGTK
ncbi:YqgQ family protein [Abyssicoccus albus]|uniref:YqgQ family protein n=1 Tax=Abyssicoccus albus TaxID=1817405 RepID=UPI0009FAB6DC|nr:YqgQ family protein [Abyssicoccus albus]